MRRWITALIVAALPLLAAAPARAQDQERILSYDVSIQVRADGVLRITEAIDYDFGSTPRHGIIREVPTRFEYDDVNDRVYPLHVESVTATDAPADVDVTQQGSSTDVRIGDPDVEVTGRHTYTIVYTVEGVLNGFPDHDELYWNAVGLDWSVPIERARVEVATPAAIRRVICFIGYEGSTEPCGDRDVSGSTATFRAGRELYPYEAFTIVVALPKGAVAEPAEILKERWAPGRAFSVAGAPGATAAGALIAMVGMVWLLWWRRGRDRRYRGSRIDQVMGNPTGEDEAIPAGEADAEAPVEFAPPGDIRPGQVGTLIDERANVLDVTATIVDLAVRGHLVIHELPKHGLLGKPDWRLIRLDHEGSDLLPYEDRLLDGLFRDGSEVTVSELRTTFVDRLHQVQEALYADAMKRRWFTARPDRVAARWAGRGVLLILAGGAITFVLARWTHFGLTGLAVIAGGIAMVVAAGRMPARTAAGTALAQRVRGFRRVIDKAEKYQSRWAEQENVFTRYLPYAVVFGLTEKWAKAFEQLGIEPDTSSFYVGTHPFVWAEFSDAVDGFAVTTGGTLASTPASSGSSGFSGGGGSSGGGAGGGGGGSW
jgi:uncharacterized membrane protein YgcG